MLASCTFQFRSLKSKMELDCFDYHPLRFNVFCLVSVARSLLFTLKVRSGHFYI